MSRNEQIKAERRRRNTDSLSGKRRRLAVNEAGLDRANFEYRWVNDEGTRLYQLTQQDDWEVVADRDGSLRPGGTGVGAEVATPIGIGPEGASRAVLLRKPKAFYDADEQMKQRQIDETEAAIKGGATPGAAVENRYTPKSGGIEIVHRDMP
jgi:hypothetical protein